MSTWRLALGRPAVLAHRGASALYLENSLEALLAARDQGADGVEFDVRLCASGELVVFHDEDLSRLSGDPRRVDELGLAELQAVALGPGAARVPTLRQVLAELDRGQIINVELKSVDARRLLSTARAAARELARCPAPGRVILSSFDPRLLALVRRLSPDIARAHLFHAGQSAGFRSPHLARALGAAALHPEHVLVDEISLRRWRCAGFRVHAWTVNDAHRVRELARIGVDAVFSDEPALARRALEGAEPSSR